ncbi:hypothetical protein VA7868_03370 [Vibrio aerogenes CECT 7868]|uniref:Uncharacterized protein n=1 Tax=Vibrio aerogenes CECT 7868 TaxID=1216006 RepID=A0A1M5ZXB5_9VIBR|nr:hypothetical protein VA7868_03370 [Vibrio aerogenes CECT 7868]
MKWNVLKDLADCHGIDAGSIVSSRIAAHKVRNPARRKFGGVFFMGVNIVKWTATL